jgi:molybdopterin-guanine dinucleotide biosynthesis protein A
MAPRKRSPILGAVLVGGFSRRLGRDKGRLSLGGVELALLQARRLEAFAGEVVLVARAAGRYEDLGFPVWVDRRPGCGPVAGLERALEGAGDDRSVLLLACDLPFVRMPLLAALAAWEGREQARFPRGHSGDAPLCGIVRPEARVVVSAFLHAGGRSFRGLLGNLWMSWLEGEELEEFGDPDRLFFNLNRPEDYERAVGLIEETGHGGTEER